MLVKIDIQPLTDIQVLIDIKKQEVFKLEANENAPPFIKYVIKNLKEDIRELEIKLHNYKF